MRVAVLLLSLAIASCGQTPCERGPVPLPLKVTSILAFALTTPTVTACIDSYCDVINVSTPTTSAIHLPNDHGSLEIAAAPGGTLITLHFDEGPAPEIASDDGGGSDASAHADAGIVDGGITDGGTVGHAHDGSAVYLLVYEPSYGRNVLERAAPVPVGAGCANWSMSL